MRVKRDETSRTRGNTDSPYADHFREYGEDQREAAE